MVVVLSLTTQLKNPHVLSLICLNLSSSLSRLTFFQLCLQQIAEPLHFSTFILKVKKIMAATVVNSGSGTPTTCKFRGFNVGFREVRDTPCFLCLSSVRIVKSNSSKLLIVAQKDSLKKQRKLSANDDVGDSLLDKLVGSGSKLEFNKNIASTQRYLRKKSRAPPMEDFLESGNDFEMLSNDDDNDDNSRRKNDGEADTLDARGSAFSNSRGWGIRGSVDRYERSMGVPQRRFKNSAKNSDSIEFFSKKSFRELGCSEFMIDALNAQLFTRPSHIQAMAFRKVIQRKSCIIADQSGSGKTLAYLIPILQHLREEELQGLSKSLPRSPRVLIIVPTAELASQVLNNCRSMSKFGVPFRSMVVTGGFRQKTQLENLEQGVDVLIATPGRFMFLIKEGFLELTNLKCAVLDEVDILFTDEDFEVSLQSLINSSPVTMQYLFVTATLPVDVYNKLVEVFPDCEVIMGPGMHRTSVGLEEVLVDCSGETESEKSPESAFLNKKSALLEIVERSPVSKTIIFCNKIETCRKVENALKRFDRKEAQVRVLPFHAALDQRSRGANMKEFMNYQSGNSSLFLVCTDRASRGIDFSGVDHVVLFDFPRDPSEYVRRVGRTARGAGGRGKAFIFVVGKQVSLARRIPERNQKGHPLHDVPAAYEVTA